MKILIPALTATFILSACSASENAKFEDMSATTPATVKVELTPLQRGAKIFTRCRTCHTLDEGGRNKVGPNLWDVYGSQSGSKEGFAYSKAMKAANIVWDEETMDGYLKKPSNYMPGNKMTFIGVKKQEDRDAVQAYIKSKTTP